MGLGGDHDLHDGGDHDMKEVVSIADFQACWLIINSKVYDVTKFVADHPGGKEVLLEAAGKDASQGFEEAGHGSAARLMLDEFYVREVEPQTDPVTAATTIFTCSSLHEHEHHEDCDSNSMKMMMLWGLGLGSLMFAIWWSWCYKFFILSSPNPESN